MNGQLLLKPRVAGSIDKGAPILLAAGAIDDNPGLTP